jgi:Rab-GTPase-TBC domain/Regulator of chromosome condensation (RCC1) repeat
MNEKIYCWGQLSENKNTHEPVELQMIEKYDGLNINRQCAYIWKGKDLYTWTSFTEMPILVQTVHSDIISATYGINNPFIHTQSQVYPETLEKNTYFIASTTSGYISLTKTSQVISWATKSVILDRVISICSSSSYFLGLTDTGDVYKWAHIHIPSLLKFNEDFSIKISFIYTGSEHSVFVTNTSHVFVLGSNSYGQISLGDLNETEIPVLLKGISCKKAACGGFHTLILDHNGQLYSCGLGKMGQLGQGTYENSYTLQPFKLQADPGSIIDIFCTDMTTIIKFFIIKHKNSFRPQNLEPKSRLLSFFHRQLVDDAENAYLKKIAIQEKLKNKMNKKQAKRENEIQKTLKLFETQIIPHWDDMRYTKTLAELIKKGLPSKVRGDIWMRLIGNDPNITQKVFLMSLLKTKATPCDVTMSDNALLISLDISRTFNSLGYFSDQSPMKNDLRDLLEAASAYRDDIGYIQGMSYVAGMLLLNLNLFQAFQAFLSIITTPQLMPFFKIDQEGIQKIENIFLVIFSHNLPDLCRKFDREGVQPTIFMVEWFVTLYSKTFNQEVSARIWDNYFYFGSITLFKTGISILKILHPKLINGDLTVIMENISHIYDRITDPDAIINIIDQIKIPEDYLEMINNL